MISVYVNGEPLELSQGTTVADLLNQLSIHTSAIAVECNGMIVQKPDHSTCQLNADDAIEIVTLVGGG